MESRGREAVRQERYGTDSSAVYIMEIQILVLIIDDNKLYLVSWLWTVLVISEEFGCLLLFL